MNLISFLLALCPVFIAAETADYITLGKRFIFGFLEGDAQAHVYVTTQSSLPVWVNVSIPGRPYFNEFTVKSHAQVSILLPQDVNLEGNGPQSSVVLVEAESPVSVYGISKTGNNLGDGFVAIPIAKLGKEYYIASYHPDHPNKEFSQIAVFAPEHDTAVRIHTRNTIQNFNLNKNEAFQIQNADDLTGTLISSTKPVAVIAGVYCATIPHGTGGCEYLIEQFPDVNALGRQYIISPFLNRIGYLFRIVATQRDTNIDITGSTNHSLLLQSGQFEEFEEHGNDTTLIIADKPVLVVQYAKGNQHGDPFMTIVPSIQMFHGGVNIFVPQSDTTQNFVSVTSRCSDGPSLSLTDTKEDVTNTSLPQIWDSQYERGQFCVYMKELLDPGTFRVSVAESVDARFSVLMYGNSEFYSYAFPVAYQKEGDACSSNPCLNEATCFNRQSRYDFLCLCQPGWQGRNCDTAQLPQICENISCNDKGRCYKIEEDGEEGYICLCRFGWGGKDCNEDVVNECEMAGGDIGACGPHGVCLDVLGGYECKCDTGFTGKRCDMGLSSNLDNMQADSPTAGVIIVAGVIVGCLCFVAVVINVAFITRERCSIRRRQRRRRNETIEEFRAPTDSVRRRQLAQDQGNDGVDNPNFNRQEEDRETGS